MSRYLVNRRLAAIGLCIVCAGPIHAASIAAQPRSQAQYRDHLKALGALTAQCEQHIDAAHCSADAVGPDDIVTASEHAAPRLMPYGWLRHPLELIGSHKINPADSASLLNDAAQRIQLELSEAPVGSSSTAPGGPARTAERMALASILQRAEFRHTDRSFTQRVLEAVALWINRRLFGLAEYSSHRRWPGLLLEWGLVACACLGLAYWFVRQTRRARGLQPESASRVANAPATRGWQRLRMEAEEAARQQRWRDAVRGYYWAAIARSESRGQWPADRARTPRESATASARTSQA